MEELDALLGGTPVATPATEQVAAKTEAPASTTAPADGEGKKKKKKKKAEEAKTEEATAPLVELTAEQK